LLFNDQTRPASAKRGAIAWVAFPELKRQAQLDAKDDSTKNLAYFMDALNRLKPKGDTPIESMPLLVRFRDPNDPKTVERVDPNDLAASFGAGVKLTRATVEITDDPLTTGIEKRLPWLAGEHSGSWIIPPVDRSGNRPAVEGQLEYGDFWRYMQ